MIQRRVASYAQEKESRPSRWQRWSLPIQHGLRESSSNGGCWPRKRLSGGSRRYGPWARGRAVWVPRLTIAAHLHLFVRRRPCQGSLSRAGGVTEIKVSMKASSSSSRGPLIAMWSTPKLRRLDRAARRSRGSKCHGTRMPLDGSGRREAQPRRSAIPRDGALLTPPRAF